MVSAVIGTDSFKTEISTSGHILIADEAAEAGGGDLGPSPPEFVSVALASCTAITLRMYANRKNLAVQRIKVDVIHEKRDNTTVFVRTIYLEGSLTDDQKQRLLQIAESCPVHKMLTNPIEITTQLL